MTKFIIVRHGESIANTQGIYQGQTYDTDLSELGKKQAKALAKRVKEMGIVKIMASPLKRTYQTALEASKLLGIPVEKNNLIIETNHGEWEGKSKLWIEQNHRGLYQQWLNSPGEVGFPGGETFLQTFERVQNFIAGSLSVVNTLIVTHDNIIRIIAAMADGLSLDDIWKYDIEPAAINYFEVSGINGKSRLKALKLNDNGHLEGLRVDLGRHAL
jgi:phosphoserine phosphatase